MIEQRFPLDGNAAGGPLTRLFAADITGAIVTCVGCGREGPLATLALYGRESGLILRCPGCATINLRFLDTGKTMHLDLRGCALLTIHEAGSA